MVRSTSSIVLLSIALAGCDSTETPPISREIYPDAVAIRDSVGVSIVESAAPTWTEGEEWVIDPEPVLVLGQTAGDRPYLFSSIETATRLRDGRIALVEGMSREIRIFDSEGQHVVTLGRAGEGPGEFQTPPDIALVWGDTLKAFDELPLRLTWFTLDGDVIRDEQLSRTNLSEYLSGVFPGKRVHFPDGSFFFVGSFGPSNSPLNDRTSDPDFTGGYRFTFRMVSGSLATTDVRLAVILPEGDGGVDLGRRLPSGESGYAGNVMAVVPVPNAYFAPTVYAAESWAEQIHIGVAGKREIHTYDTRGGLRRVVRQLTALQPLNADLIDRERSKLREAAEARGTNLASAMEVFDQIVFPDSIYPYDALHADTEGNVWALEHEPNADIRRYHVFDPLGAWLGTVEIPRDVGEIMEIGEDHLLTVYRDAFDIPSLRVYRILR